MSTLVAEIAPSPETVRYWESQFDDSGETIQVGYVRPPQEETYGRSLSTIRRLGAFMIRAASMEEVINSPEADQTRIEFFTSVREGLGTDTELGARLEVRDFDTRPIINGRVMSKDLKTAISDMTEAGLRCAEETAKKDRRFLPQLTRSVWDHENALEVDRMARGETGYNMRMVVSPFPAEAAKQSGNAYWRKIGYVPSLERGFVQLYCVIGKDLFTGSLSFDGSNLQRLRELFGEQGIEIPMGESTDNVLKYAIIGNLSKRQAKAFATSFADRAGDPRHQKNTNTVDITEQYGSIMDRAFNESYVHICESLARGCQTPGARTLIFQLAHNAHNFNEHYATALHRMRANGNQFTDEDSVALHELLVYSTIEMMRALHLQETSFLHRSGYGRYDDMHAVVAYLQSANVASFQNMLGGFGAEGARNDRVYSACGLEMKLGDSKPGDDSQSENDLNPQEAFGGRDSAKKRAKDKDKLGSRWFACRKGHLNYRRVANVKEKRCQTCQVDVSCKKPQPKAKAAMTWHRVLGLREAGAHRRAKAERALGRKAIRHSPRNR